MKKLILFLTLLFVGLGTTFEANAQYLPSNNLNYIKLLKTPPIGSVEDSVMVYDSSSSFVKMLPKSSIVAGKESISNKTSTISGYSTTLYPNEKATHDALDLKLNISDLPTNLTLYPTTTTSDVSGYVKMVTDIHDADYNTIAVDISTPTITTTDQLVASLITDAGVLIGHPGVFNATTFGNIRRLSGSGTATFYFKVFHRDITGMETLIGTSSNTEVITSSSYLEFTGALLWDDGDFIATDRIVIKYYANRIAGSSDPIYQFQFGGASPVRTLLPVPFSVVDAGYELKSNKQNDLTPDGTGTKYPTVDAVNNALPTSYSKIVYVNTTSPTTATIFDLENPPVTNDNALKNDTANLYIGTDASTWVYLTGTGYVTKTISSATSNFNTFGTTVDAGNSKTSHITRSGPVTLTGSLNLAVAKISTTPNTSASSYDVLTRNSSTTALEKKLVSDFLQTTGNQSFTGTKTGVSTTATPANITLVNENNFTGASVANFTNSATSSTNSTSALLVSNDNAGGATSAIQMRNNSSGFGGFFKNLSTGIGVYFENWSYGIGFQFDSRTGSTGDLIRFTKNALNTTVINHLGEITTMTPTASGQVSTKGYTDAKITQTITNGVTDKSPSEDAVYDALGFKFSGSGTTNYVPKFTASGTIGNSQIFDSGTNISIGAVSSAYKLRVKGGNATTLQLDNGGENYTELAFANNGVDKAGNIYNLAANNYQIVNKTAGRLSLGISDGVNLQIVPSGSILIAKTTDDGIATNKLQVNGNITSNIATLSNQVVVKSQLDAIRPYRVYTALLSQTGTNAPTATVLENTLGGTIVWSRSSTGIYIGTLSGAFTVDKTLTLMNTGHNVNGFEGINMVDVNSVQIQTYLNGPTYSDGRLANSGASIEIRVYN